MSLFNRAAVQCPNCGTEQTVDLVVSINADRRPDLRQQILDRAFQGPTCSACGASFLMPPRFTYLDFARRQWILAHSGEDLPKWSELEAEAAEVFATNYGPGTPPAARQIGREISPRIVFGWPALREKLVLRELGLDDVEFELMKMAVIRNIPGSPLTDETELRLIRGEGDTLVLAWIERATETPGKSLRVPRQVYDEVAADGEAWAPLRAELAGHSFVDGNRLLVG